MPDPDTCIFCAIIAGSAPGSVVYRDGVCVAFMDIQPVNPGHVLVVPLAHAADLAALEAETGAQLMRVAANCRSILCSIISDDWTKSS